VLYAREEARTPTIVNLGAGIAGALLMLVTASVPDSEWQVPLLAAIHALAYSRACALGVQVCDHGDFNAPARAAANLGLVAAQHLEYPAAHGSYAQQTDLDWFHLNLPMKSAAKPVK